MRTMGDLLKEALERSDPQYKLTMIDMCLPDYFNGHPNPVLQVPIWKDMTKKELMQAIVSEYNMLWEHLCEGHEHPWPNLSDRKLLTMADKFILTETPFANDGIPTAADYDKEQINNHIDDVYIFIICEEVY